MFEIQDKEYEIIYTLGRIEIIEKNLKDSVIHLMSAKEFTLSIAELKTFVGCAVKEVGSETYMSIRNGLEIAEKLIITNGYAKVMDYVIEALMRDCPFFFQEG